LFPNAQLARGFGRPAATVRPAPLAPGVATELAGSAVIARVLFLRWFGSGERIEDVFESGQRLETAFRFAFSAFHIGPPRVPGGYELKVILK
jgi:hypothetical protein